MEPKKINTLFLIRGCPGAGKTTAAEMLAWDMDHIHGPVRNYPVHSADDYFYENGSNPDKYEFDVSKLHIAHKQCKDRVEFDMGKGITKIFVANTFTTEKEMSPYFELAKKYGYRVISLIVENRHGNKSIHNVPDNTVEKMVNRFNIKLI